MRMKYLLLLVCCFSVLAASQWQDDWIKGKQLYSKGLYREACDTYEQAILKDSGHVELYLSLAQAKFKLGNYQECLNILSDVDILFPNLSKDDVQFQCLYRSLCNANLNQVDEYKESWNKFLLNAPNRPLMYETDQYIYIVNAPDCCGFKKSVAKALELMDGITEIKWLADGTGIAKKVSDCGCGCKMAKPKPDEVKKSCRNFCDKMSIAGMVFCGNAFKSSVCQAACCLAVDYIKEYLCYRCCEKGGYGETCVSHFENIIKYMKAPCYSGEGDEQYL